MGRVYERRAARTGHPFDYIEGLPCRDTPEDFFPPQGGSPTAGTTTCQTRCPIQAACLTFALETGQAHGTWGGLCAGARDDLPPSRRTELRRAGQPQLLRILAHARTRTPAHASEFAE